MSARRRGYVRLGDKLAAALACLLPAEQRDDLRARNVPAGDVIALFEMDHVVLHALGGSDEWYNLDPKLNAPHREKSRRDTAIVAKIKRITQRQGDGIWASAPVKRTRKIASRPNHWPKGRKLRSRTSFR